MTYRAGIIGGSGYVGGELLRILSRHPSIKIDKVYSRTYTNKYIHSVHPNLRGIVEKMFTDEDIASIVETSDIAFFALPHGQSSRVIPKLNWRSSRIVDLSADFRLKRTEDYETWYGYKHPSPDLLIKFVYGIPEINGKEISCSNLVSIPGCIAVCSILSMLPLAVNSLIERVIIDAKVGSSGSGAKPSISTHFSERYNVVRPYKPAGHRHTIEIIQALSSLSNINIKAGISVHAVNMVRGILTTSHIITEKSIDVAELWKIYREFYEGKPFVRIVRDRKGKNRYPDPKFSLGSNYADVGFEVDSYFSRILAIGALDNLVKGAAGNAIQCANLMLGLPETEGLAYPPIYPA